jgi:hypothetical protein
MSLKNSENKSINKEFGEKIQAIGKSSSMVVYNQGPETSVDE